MMKNSRLTKRYGPGGKAGLVSGMANARPFTSSSVTRALLVQGQQSFCEIEHAHAGQDLASLLPVTMGTGTPHVVEPCFPELADGRARELVVLRVGRRREASVDEMRDGERTLVLAQRLQQLVVRVVSKFLRQPLQQASKCVAQTLQLLDASGIESRLARILDVLGALEDLVEIDRQLTSGAEQIYLNDQGLDLRRIVQHVPQRRVRHEPTIPVIVPVDLDGGETRRQRPARHDVVRSEPTLPIVEVDRVSGVYVHRTHTQPDAVRVV